MTKTKNDDDVMDYWNDFETFFSSKIPLLAKNDVSFSWIYAVHYPRQNTRCFRIDKLTTTGYYK